MDKNPFPTSQIFHQFALSNRDFETPLFESISIADNPEHDPKTNVAVPPTMTEDEATSWVG